MWPVSLCLVSLAAVNKIPYSEQCFRQLIYSYDRIRYLSLCLGSPPSAIELVAGLLLARLFYCWFAGPVCSVLNIIWCHYHLWSMSLCHNVTLIALTLPACCLVGSLFIRFGYTFLLLVRQSPVRSILNLIQCQYHLWSISLCRNVTLIAPIFSAWFGLLFIHFDNTIIRFWLARYLLGSITALIPFAHMLRLSPFPCGFSCVHLTFRF